MKALVTGGAGFIGRWVVKRLLDDGVITSINGKKLPIKVQSILLHGDTPGAVEAARDIRREIESGNGRIVPLSRLV